MLPDRIDVSSTLVEKGLDMAKEFLDRILMPPLEEAGLLIKDQVAKFRFNNQVQILLMARKKVEAAGFDPKTIDFKILCPLLESASLESEPTLQLVWTDLLVNMADPKVSLQNHIYPYILGQLSKVEWLAISLTVSNHRRAVANYDLELAELSIYTQKRLHELRDNKVALETAHISDIPLAKRNELIEEMQKEVISISSALRDKKTFDKNRIELEYKQISEDYQYANLLRLGLIKRVPNYYTYIEGRKATGTILLQNTNNRDEYNYDYGYTENKITFDLDDLEVSVEEDDDNIYISDLGLLFVDACSRSVASDDNSQTD